METQFKGHANDGGIYRILNKTNNREYIGSTVRFKQRSRDHLRTLLKGKHHCSFLQNDFNKCGSDSFIFEVVEKVINSFNDRAEWKKNLIKKEQLYIDIALSKPKDSCYNSRKTATYLGHNICDEERKIRISKANKEAWKDESLREQASIDANKRWNNADYPTYQLTHKDTGETVIINSSLREWCLEHGLNYKAMHLLVNGKTKVSCGYFLGTKQPIYVDRKGEKRKPLTLEQKNAKSNGKFEGKLLVNDYGEMLVVEKNIKEQCRRLGLHYTTFLKVLSGSCKSIGGWKNKDDTQRGVL